MASLMTFGRYVSESRKEKDLSQKQLAELVKREDQSISPQYLNDIEHDRRVPATEVIQKMAEVLGVDVDYLHYLAKKWPADLSEATLGPDQVRSLMFAFRQASKK